jgi:hypothetical protein
VTADEHLQQIMGSIIASLIVQLAVLKAENERLRAACERLAPDGVMPSAP